MLAMLPVHLGEIDGLKVFFLCFVFFPYGTVFLLGSSNLAVSTACHFVCLS